MLDEPTEGVQRENIIHIANLITDRKKSGSTFVIVEQNLDLLEALGDHVLVLDQGRVMLSGRADIVSREDILQHLGV
jgi:ABC-type branched-subunit amino acid transport system ATPase component